MMSTNDETQASPQRFPVFIAWLSQAQQGMIAGFPPRPPPLDPKLESEMLPSPSSTPSLTTLSTPRTIPTPPLTPPMSPLATEPPTPRLVPMVLARPPLMSLLPSPMYPRSLDGMESRDDDEQSEFGSGESTSSSGSETSSEDSDERSEPVSPESISSSESETSSEHGGDPVLEEDDFVTGFPLVCLMAGLMIAQFLISIDRTIISTVRAME